MKIIRFDPELLSLREEFADSFSERHEHLAKVLSRMGVGKIDSTLALEVQYSAHRVAGSASTYGFPFLGQLAGALDDWLAEKEKLESLDALKVYTQLFLEALEAASKTREDPVKFAVDERMRRLISDVEAIASAARLGSS